MTITRAPLILVGQVYLNGGYDAIPGYTGYAGQDAIQVADDVNEYLIVTGNNRGQVSYEGIGFKGQAEAETFIERFAPVDPDDVDPSEISALLELCPKGTQALTGFVAED